MSVDKDEQLTISIDRASKSWAVFGQHGTLLTGFHQFELELDGLDAAMEWCRHHGVESPHVVYPRITAFRQTRTRK